MVKDNGVLSNGETGDLQQDQCFQYREVWAREGAIYISVTLSRGKTSDENAKPPAERAPVAALRGHCRQFALPIETSVRYYL